MQRKVLYMEYRIVYRRTIGQDEAQNELKGNTPETAMQYFEEKDLDEWASAVLESRNNSYEKAEFQSIGNVMSFHDEADARVITGRVIYTFRKNILRSLLERGIDWEKVKCYALKTEATSKEE